MFAILSALLSCAVLLSGTTEIKAEKTLVERLGYRATDRLLIIHADDVGMCHSVNMATIQAMERGVVSSASIMVPCPWMPEIAEYCVKHPKADFGLHLTLTSEWEKYRWRPVTSISEVPGLLDSEGFIHSTVEETVAKASTKEVEMEIRAQIKRAKQFGIVPTHVDSHMGTLFTGKFIGSYAKVAKEFGILPMMLEPTPARIEMGKQLGYDSAKISEGLRAQGYVLLDMLHEDIEGKTLEERRDDIYRIIRNLKPGVTEIIVHLALNDDEIQHISHSWQRRYFEYQIMTDPKTREFIEAQGVKLIGYRELSKLAYQPQK